MEWKIKDLNSVCDVWSHEDEKYAIFKESMCQNSDSTPDNVNFRYIPINLTIFCKYKIVFDRYYWSGYEFHKKRNFLQNANLTKNSIILTNKSHIFIKMRNF